MVLTTPSALVPARSGEREREGDFAGEAARSASVVKSGGSGGRRRGESSCRGLERAAELAASDCVANVLTARGRALCCMWTQWNDAVDGRVNEHRLIFFGFKMVQPCLFSNLGCHLPSPPRRWSQGRPIRRRLIVHDTSTPRYPPLVRLDLPAWAAPITIDRGVSVRSPDSGRAALRQCSSAVCAHRKWR